MLLIEARQRKAKASMSRRYRPSGLLLYALIEIIARMVEVVAKATCITSPK